MTEPISEFDLMAYVDDQLDAGRRIEVEEYLSRHPQLAAQVMDDLFRRDELRLALTEAATVTGVDQAILPAERLGRRLSVRKVLHRSRRAIAASFLLATGWLAHATFGGLGADPASAAHIMPVYADEAVEAHRTILLEERNGLFTRTAAAPERIADLATGANPAIPLPHLPKTFTPVASHLVPWDHGNAVQVLFHDPSGESLTLFAVETDSFSIEQPYAEEVDGVTIAYWQSGWFAYVLGGSVDRDDLLTLAVRISR
ncbi:hypothetical protein IGS68_12905 [Skermanella sp. TT6]|uniref:Anti-sigma factor RsiW n=1 Tax=Skermanella cutis TaxID=2775420 RepID=A0ABX7BEM6_9PROT|nr:hypothetical protein [Skermanella sp. TT6]QQP92040.1 hypothetical protein IGS68_12905 [Skermanella sp. TT6]